MTSKIRGYLWPWCIFMDLDEAIPTKSVTPSNLTILFSESDDQSYRRLPDVTSIKTEHNVLNRSKMNGSSEPIYGYSTLQNNLKERNVKLLPDRSVCGPLTEEERIYGGENTTIDEFPWLVRIKYILDDGKEVYACAGSLITDHYVLTAAHCAVNLTIHALDVKVIHVIPYPGYTKTDAFKGDIALLKLQRRVNFTDFIRPICLPTTELVSSQDYSAKSIYWTAGWGKREFEKKPAIEKKVELISVPISAECRIKQTILSDDTESFTICAGGTQGKDTCVGDSGGSLVKQVHEKNTTNWFIMGVTSYGYKECGGEGRPGLFARITPYMHWIMQNIE